MGRAGAAAACLAAAAALGAGCGGDKATGDGTGVDINPGDVTYYRDVLPIVVEHCAGCHAPGGFAPFSLVTYEEARAYAGPAAAATTSGSMPPWPPAEGCGTFENTRRLSATEVATFAAWDEGGAPAGDSADAPADLTPPTTDLGAPSATLDPGTPYRPNPAVTDDYHCFLVDPGLGATRDLVGFDIHPGVPASVHHVLLFAVPPQQFAAAAAKDAAEPGAGWTCFGATGVGTTAADAPPTIGGWVPGSGAVAFPPPTGIRLVAGTRVILQVHYNLLAQRDVLDRTTVDLYYAAAPVEKPARILPLANNTFVIPPGAVQTVTADVPVMGSFDLWGVVPHMHLHGSEIKLSALHPDGTSTCGIHIPRWDFHWQQFYYYDAPLPGDTGDVVRLECTFDNTAGDHPLRWGEATTDEMCLTYLYFTRR